VTASSAQDRAVELARAGYLADEGIATAVHLALALGKPLLLEGAPGVGKTSVAKALSSMLGRRLIRLQCHEGIDAAQALYEWNHARQLLAVRAHHAVDFHSLYGDDYLIERPLLAALRAGDTAVLLVDEVDRADDAFEAFLLEFLGEGQITIPERGTVSAATPPLAVLTSNRTRELHDALRRRCLYHWIDYPSAEREAAIVRLNNPRLPDEAVAGLVSAVSRARFLPLVKKPGVSESIDWARAAAVLAEEGSPWPEALRRSIGLLVKDPEDLELIGAEAPALLAGVT
jgi:MoxR-like ATPase